jgi:CheY-like chemotaxis protein
VRRAALASGMTTLFMDGERKVARGVTTLDELRRVAPPDEVQEPEDPEQSGARKVPAPLSPEAGVARRSRILVVDDDAAFRDALRETLESENYEVVAVGSAQEGLAETFRRAPDLVLTDLHLPDMDGIELLQRLRGDLSTCRIPVLLLTVVDSHATEVQALDLGADDYVTKPVERARLLSRIRRALFRTQLQRMGV